MNRKSKVGIAVVYILIIILTFALVTVFGRTYTVYLPNMFSSEKTDVTMEKEGIIESIGVQSLDDVTAFSFRTIKSGDVLVRTTIYSEENDTDYTTAQFEFRVMPTGVIYLTGYDFGGWQFVVAGLAGFLLYTFAVSIFAFLKQKKENFFSHKTILSLGLSVFTGLSGLMYAVLAFCSFVFPQRFEGWLVYNLAGLIMSVIFFLSLPVIALFACFMTASNISLIRHEGYGKNNAFGFMISFVLLAGSVICIYTVLTQPNATGLQLRDIRDSVIRSIFSSAFVYFESILFSTQILTQYASRHKPAYDKDYIIILGCKTRKDGTPLPLLQGRIDKAIEFYKEQLKETGKKACFIPSGGKGSDEIMSEAESMTNYLLSKGISRDSIMPETESKTTLENMKYSKAIIDGHSENANVIFSTTNYHVFRSGVLAAKAGLKADGMGAKTKWYFWPNAQMREFIGLIYSEWKINLFVILLIVSLSVLFANISTVINSIAG